MDICVIYSALYSYIQSVLLYMVQESKCGLQFIGELFEFSGGGGVMSSMHV